MRHHARAVGASVAILVVAGCGGAGGHRAVQVQTTVPAYAGFPPDTISVEAGDPRSKECRVDAEALAGSSLRFVTLYPADTYYMVMREEFTDFEARRCDHALLGRALRQTLKAHQRDALVEALPDEYAGIVRKALAASG